MTHKIDILEKLADLLKQATTERSHYYVAGCCKEARASVESWKKMTTSTPRIRSVSPTAKGLACPVFMRWLFERLNLGDTT